MVLDNVLAIIPVNKDYVIINLVVVHVDNYDFVVHSIDFNARNYNFLNDTFTNFVLEVINHSVNSFKN